MGKTYNNAAVIKTVSMLVSHMEKQYQTTYGNMANEKPVVRTHEDN